MIPSFARVNIVIITSNFLEGTSDERVSKLAPSLPNFANILEFQTDGINCFIVATM